MLISNVNSAGTFSCRRAYTDKASQGKGGMQLACTGIYSGTRLYLQRQLPAGGRFGLHHAAAAGRRLRADLFPVDRFQRQHTARRYRDAGALQQPVPQPAGRLFRHRRRGRPPAV